MNKAKLSSIADYVSDKVPVASLDKANYIGVDNMLPNYKGITQADYLPNEGNATRFMPGDILLGNIRPYFKKIWLATFEGGCSPDVLVIRPAKEVTPEYLYAALATDHFFAFNMSGAKGSKMPRGDKNHIMSYPVPLFATQERIGAFVKSINTKIENNSAICAELEAMAKLLYDYWFVQFDFPDENGKPYKSSGGKMVWSEELKREIPEGWESCRLGKMCSVISGYPFDSSSYDPNGQYSVLTIKNIQDGYIEPITDSKVRCIPHDIPQCDILQPGDILMSLTGNVGRVGLLCGNNYLLNQRASVAKPHNDRHKWFVYFLLRDISVCTQIQRIATGTSQKNVSPMDIHRIAVPYNSQLCDLFSATVDSVVNRIIECNKENSELVSLRDFLLPLLMNGQITFKEADCH